MARAGDIRGVTAISISRNYGIVIYRIAIRVIPIASGHALIEVHSESKDWAGWVPYIS